LDIREVLRRLQLGERDRRIARDLRLSRKTVGKYREWAAAQGLLTGALPEPAELQAALAATLPVVHPPRMPSSVEPFRQRIVDLRKHGVECRAIHQILRDEGGFTGAYQSVYRFVRRLEPRTPEAVVRVETAPGEEAQVDFGDAGLMHDPRSDTRRKAWAFVMTLSFSRHSYVEFCSTRTSRRGCAVIAAPSSGSAGCPTAWSSITSRPRYDPVVQRAYRECAEHYGFLISPCRPRTPEHKGKVEQGVHYVARNVLAGRAWRDITEANDRVLVWCVETAGRRIHGTTKELPLARFDEIERATLLPVPSAPYALATWKKAKLHPDCHVVFEDAFYSAPHRLIGQRLWVRGADTSVQSFHEHLLVASHPRASRRGPRITNPDHLPPAKVAGLLATPASCVRRAADIGPATSELVGRLLGERPLDRLRTVRGILKLAHKYGPRRLEGACTRALRYDDVAYATIKRILEHGLDQVAEATPPTPPRETTLPLFARPITDVFPSSGGSSCN
jgi:transposase